jgi:hypothetical protein
MLRRFSKGLVANVDAFIKRIQKYWNLSFAEMSNQNFKFVCKKIKQIPACVDSEVPGIRELYEWFDGWCNTHKYDTITNTAVYLPKYRPEPSLIIC